MTRRLLRAVAPALLIGAAPPPVTFGFAVPAQVRADPVLNAWFMAEDARLRDAVTAQALADRGDAAAHHRPFFPFETRRTWSVADLPRFLSLLVERCDYAGGAHGSTTYAALLWNREAQERRAPLSLFDRAALRAALTPRFCPALDAERRRRRGGAGGGMGVFANFDACIDPTAETVLLGSAGKRRFDRIGIRIAPYDAGPFAEGSYEVTLPVTPAVVAAVRPEWRRFFAAGAA